MHKFTYVVGLSLLQAAYSEWARLNGLDLVGYRSIKESGFYEAVGITKKQVVNYEDCWVLSVDRVAYKKIELLASLNTEHWKTMFKIIDVRDED